jgi:hypothetical protein
VKLKMLVKNQRQCVSLVGKFTTTRRMRGMFNEEETSIFNSVGKYSY